MSPHGVQSACNLLGTIWCCYARTLRDPLCQRGGGYLRRAAPFLGRLGLLHNLGRGQPRRTSPAPRKGVVPPRHPPHCALCGLLICTHKVICTQQKKGLATPSDTVVQGLQYTDPLCQRGGGYLRREALFPGRLGLLHNLGRGQPSRTSPAPRKGVVPPRHSCAAPSVAC